MKKILLSVATFITSTLVLAGSVKDVSPQQAAEMQRQSSLIVDVRENDEWNAGHIAGAIHIPLSEISNRLNELEKYKNAPVIMQCRSGVRSAKAANLLAKSGFMQIYNMEGGLNAWQDANLKIQK